MAKSQRNSWGAVAAVALAATAWIARADTFALGSRVVEVQPPEGFSRILPDMGAAYEMLSLFEDPVNETLAVYIPVEEADAARNGEIPSMRRYFMLKVNTTLKSQAVSESQFAELKRVMQKSRNDMLRDAMQQFPDLIQGAQRRMSEATAMEVAARLEQMAPVDWETDQDDCYGFSMFMNYDWRFGEENVKSLVSATSVFTRANDCVLFLYGYGEPQDLEWTQTATVDWAASIQGLNSTPPRSAGGVIAPPRSSRVSTAAVGVVLGAIASLAVMLWAFLRKGDEEPTSTGGAGRPDPQ